MWKLEFYLYRIIFGCVLHVCRCNLRYANKQKTSEDKRSMGWSVELCGSCVFLGCTLLFPMPPLLDSSRNEENLHARKRSFSLLDCAQWSGRVLFTSLKWKWKQALTSITFPNQTHFLFMVNACYVMYLEWVVYVKRASTYRNCWNSNWCRVGVWWWVVWMDISRIWRQLWCFVWEIMNKSRFFIMEFMFAFKFSSYNLGLCRHKCMYDVILHFSILEFLLGVT